jgi:hypothetical protein
LIFHNADEPSPFEPEKSDSQLPKVVSGVADWELAGPPECVGGLPSNWWDDRNRWLADCGPKFRVN